MDSPSSMGSQTTRFSLIFLFLFYYLPCALSQLDPWLCNDLFQCGNITAGFPFSGEIRQENCGHPSLKLNCNKSSNTTSLTLSGYNYTVLNIDNTSNILRLSRQDFSGPFCSASFSTTPLPSNLFQTLPSYKSLDVFYACNPRRHFLGNFTCQIKGLGSVIQNSTYRKLCDESFSVTVPTCFFQEQKVLDLTHLESVLRNGFEVKVKMDEMDCPPECLSSTASCSYLSGYCCKYFSGTLSCSNTNFFHDMIPSTRSMLITIAQVVGPNVFIVVVMVIAFLIWRKKKQML